jgi:hypothetical protein
MSVPLGRPRNSPPWCDKTLRVAWSGGATLQREALVRQNARWAECGEPRMADASPLDGTLSADSCPHSDGADGN